MTNDVLRRFSDALRALADAVDGIGDTAEFTVPVVKEDTDGSAVTDSSSSDAAQKKETSFSIRSILGSCRRRRFG